MVPELLGEAIGIIGNKERSKQYSVNGVLPRSIPTTSSASPSPSPSPSPSQSPCSSAVANPTNSGSGSENLRCPRCDSTNTKFCYYNNYNLTQPRHFCKTCRRYWTKGGALRNVPIGGGCRKNRSPAMTTSAASGKFRAMATEMGMIRSGFMANFDQEYPSSGSPSSHLLSSLLKANQNPNPSSCSVPISSSLFNVKEETFKSGQVVSPFGNINTGSIWRENERQHSGFFVGEPQGTGSGAHDLYQRMRLSSAANYGGNNSNINSLIGSSSSSSSSLAIFDSAPVAAAHDPLGCWNPILSWSDLPASTHGAYP